MSDLNAADAIPMEQSEHERDLWRLEQLRTFDDDFMRVVFRDNLPLAQDALRIITGISGLKVVWEETQRDLKRLVGARSVELDVWALDEDGRWHDIEVQSGSAPNSKRARYHSAAMDVEALDAGQGFDRLPDQWVIFVMEGGPVW